MRPTACDLFEFWSGVSSNAKVHPADRFVMDRVKSKFNLDCLPLCFIGPLKTARIVLLYLSPGLSELDSAGASDKDHQDYVMSQRSGTACLPGKKEHEDAWRWWTTRASPFGHWEELRDRLAILDIGAYHSRNFKDHPFLVSLPSSRRTLDWAQNELFPAAVDRRRLVVCMRAHRYWGLEPEYVDGYLFGANTVRSGFMKKDKVRDQVLVAAREILARPD